MISEPFLLSKAQMARILGVPVPFNEAIVMIVKALEAAAG